MHAESLVARQPQDLSPQAFLVREQEAALALDRLGRQAFHRCDGDVGFVQGDDSRQRAGLGFIHRGQNDEVADGHHFIVDVAARNKLVVTGQPFALEQLDLAFPPLIVGAVVGVAHGAGGQEVPFLAGATMDFGGQVFPHTRQDVPPLVGLDPAD